MLVQTSKRYSVFILSPFSVYVVAVNGPDKFVFPLKIAQYEFVESPFIVKFAIVVDGNTVTACNSGRVGATA
jgi:hypothetical protein